MVCVCGGGGGWMLLELFGGEGQYYQLFVIRDTRLWQCGSAPASMALVHHQFPGETVI
jgi:hypothetical protein